MPTLSDILGYAGGNIRDFASGLRSQREAGTRLATGQEQLGDLHSMLEMASQFSPAGVVKPAMSPEALKRIANLGPASRFRLDQLLLDLGDVRQKFQNFGERFRPMDRTWFMRPESVKILKEQDDILKQLRRYPDFQNEPAVRLDNVLDLIVDLRKK